MMRVFNTLQARLALLIFFVALPGVVLFVNKFLEHRNEAINDAREAAVIAVETLAADQQHLIAETRKFLQGLAQFREVLQPDSPECGRFLAQVLSMSDYYVNLGIPGVDGELSCNALPLTKNVNVADREYFRRVLETRDFVVGEFQMDRAAGVNSINFGYPVLDPTTSQITGIAVAVVSLDWWSNKLAESWLPENALAYLSDGDRRIIAIYPENPQMLGLNETDLKIVTLDQQAHGADQNVTIGVDGAGRTRIFVSKKLPIINGNRSVTVTVGVAFDQQLAAINAESFKLGAALLLFMLSMFLVTLWGIRISVLKPLSKLTKATRSLALGRHERGIPHIGAAELVELQTLFERMAETRLQVEAQLRESQAALQDSKDYNRNLFKTSPVGLVLCSMKGELIDVNAAFASIIGRTIDDALQQSYWAITPIQYQQEEAAQLKILVSTGSYGPYEKEYVHQEGHRVSVRQSGRLLELDGQRCIFSSVEDITNYKRLEAQIRRAQKMEALGALTEGIALDFNNVLAAIQGNLLLLKKRLSSCIDPATDLVTNILNGTHRGATLVGKLLRFSRADSTETQILGANQLILDLTQIIVQTLPETIRLETDLAEALWPIAVSPDDFEDALLNLVFNARDAMPEGGILSFKTRNRTIDEQSGGLHVVGAKVATGEFVQISINDTGTGISEELRDQVFEPFFTTKEADNGTGLGLSMVYAVVQRSGGFIELESELGVGTTFNIYLPRGAEQA